MTAKISVFVTGVETIIYFSLHNLHDCTFKANFVIPWTFVKSKREESELFFPGKYVSFFLTLILCVTKLCSF